MRDIDKDKALDASPNAHQFVIERFRGSNNTTKKKIGSYLFHLRKIRNVADYQDSFRDLEMTTLQSLRYAEKVIGGLHKLRF